MLIGIVTQSYAISPYNIIASAHVGNFSIAFNISSYYTVSQLQAKFLSINCIDEEFWNISDIYIYDRGYSHDWSPSNSTYIGYVEVLNNPYWYGNIYLDRDINRTYYFVLEQGLVIASHRSLTDSIDFFRAIKIEWVGL